MKRRILVTTLFSGDRGKDKRYFYAAGEYGKALYCDAFMSAEAACKYALATGRLDEIVIFGRETMVSPEDETAPAAVADGSSYYTADLEGLSYYGLLRYRLAAFANDLHPELLDDNELLTPEEQEEAVAFLREFFAERSESANEKRPSRYFRKFAHDPALQKDLSEALGARPAALEEDYDRYRAWIREYLYREMKVTFKMELLEDNDDVRIRFVPVKEGNPLQFLKDVTSVFDQPGGEDDVELSLCLLNSEASATLNTFNLINLTKLFPDDHIDVTRMITIDSKPELPVEEISDTTRAQIVPEMMAAATAFIHYGKTDGIVRCWKAAGIDNPKIERIIYAMRNIDFGISACDMTDIERGIRSLHSLLETQEPVGGATQIEQFFEILLYGIRRDYGALLDSDKPRFIDLIKWIDRKGFWQQTLTLIESRAPRDFVERGFFTYCDSEDKIGDVAKILRQCYYDLRPSDKYQMDDPAYYYIKFYNRQNANRSRKGKDYQLGLAEMRVKELDEQDPAKIRACTICPDRKALTDLLFSYYYLSYVRNITNHAAGSVDNFYDIMDDSACSERIGMLRQAIDYFLFCYDKVEGLSAGAEHTPVTVDHNEIIQESEKLRRQRAGSRKY